MQFLGKTSITNARYKFMWNMIRCARVAAYSALEHTIRTHWRWESHQSVVNFAVLECVSVEFVRRNKWHAMWRTHGSTSEQTNQVLGAFVVRLLDVSFKLQSVNNRIAYTQSLHIPFLALSFLFRSVLHITRALPLKKKCISIDEIWDARCFVRTKPQRLMRYLLLFFAFYYYYLQIS